MNMDRPQEPYDERDHPEREDERDGATAQERDHPERVEDGRDGSAAREAERPTTTATALPGDKGDAPESTAGEQLTVLDAGASPTPPGRPTSAYGDFQVFGPGELEGYRSRWESIQLGFLDDPKGAAEQAHTVVGELLGRLTERRQALSDELNRQSDQDVDTESHAPGGAELSIALPKSRRELTGPEQRPQRDAISHRRDPARGSPASVSRPPICLWPRLDSLFSRVVMCRLT